MKNTLLNVVLMNKYALIETADDIIFTKPNIQSRIICPIVYQLNYYVYDIGLGKLNHEL